MSEYIEVSNFEIDFSIWLILWQEFRISRAVDIIVKQVENLKHQYETEHQELEETKRMIQENKVSQGGNDRNVRHVTTGGGGTKVCFYNNNGNKQIVKQIGIICFHIQILLTMYVEIF